MLGLKLFPVLALRAGFEFCMLQFLVFAYFLLLSPQSFYITDRSNAVPLMWFSVLLVLVSVSVLFSPSLCLNDFS